MPEINEEELPIRRTTVADEFYENAAFPNYVEQCFEVLASVAYLDNKAKGFWPELDKDYDVYDVADSIEDYILGAKVGLIHTEVSEYMEAIRRPDYKYSEKIPEFLEEEEEMADAFIRMLDIIGKRKLRVGAAIVAKLKYNKEQRPRLHGKRF